MKIIATYPDHKTLTVSVDPWAVTSAIESFMETGALFVLTEED
jgi:hypothetical protein